MKLLWKILLILAILIAVGYFVAPIDSEIILKKPWLENTEDFKDVIPEKAVSGEIWEIYKDARKVLWIQNEPGFLIGTAILPARTEPTKHPFLNAKALDPFEENNLQNILSQSKSFEEFLSLLRDNGYFLKKVSQ